jgi:hypothetical protein
MYRVQKKRTGDWRYDNSFEGITVADLVNEIEKKSANKAFAAERKRRAPAEKQPVILKIK